jgi:signal transduction histidine kinase
MTLSSDLPFPLSQSTSAVSAIGSVSALEKYDGLPAASGADLVFTQDAAGQYLSFYWRDAERYGLMPEQVIGKPMSETVGPLSIAPYLGRVQRVLDYLTPERLQYSLCYANQYFVFDLVISPVMMPHSMTSHVLVMGQLLHSVTQAQAWDLVNAAVYPTLLPSSDRYHKLLTQVTWNIRRTLDLETIWQQTVDGLGEALAIDRCLICSYMPDTIYLKVVAEYLQPGLTSILGQELLVREETALHQALITARPIALPVEEVGLPEPHSSILAITTCYQDQPNGLILLHQLDPSRQWHEEEIELIRELADQVGTGIAHATLLAASRELAAELQNANASLIQQHQELEEARQQAEEASRLKSEFLANTSHELRTPLNGMIGFLKLVMDGMADDPAEQSEFIEEAYRSAVHLLGIINDILDIAKIEAGKMQLDLNPVQLDDLLGDVENFTRTQAQQKNLSFEIRTPATRDAVVLIGNYQRLLQVMLNLVGNAIKFTHHGGIIISAEVVQKKILGQNQEQPGTVKISVADTGIGVSLEKQDKLFQSFSQLDGSRTRQYGGTGLGLAISQKLVEAMGGVVNFYSMGEGLGSTVTFTVPLYQDPVMIAAQASNSVNLLN